MICKKYRYGTAYNKRLCDSLPLVVHPSSAFGGTSFMLETLSEIRFGGLTKNLKTDKIYDNEGYKNAI